MDFVIVVTSIIELYLTNSTLYMIKIIRLLRTLRPLRFISRNLSMKIVVNALIASIKGIFNVAIVVIII